MAAIAATEYLIALSPVPPAAYRSVTTEAGTVLAELHFTTAAEIDGFAKELGAELRPTGDVVGAVGDVGYRALVPVPELVVYRAAYGDGPGCIPLDHYTNPDAAKAHAEDLVGREYPENTAMQLRWYRDVTDGDDETAPSDLFVTVAGEESMTGYNATPLTVRSAYDPDRGE